MPALYKSTDQAQTWQEVSLPEPFANPSGDSLSSAPHGDNLTTDGRVSYLVEHVDNGDQMADAAKLWRSTDGAWTNQGPKRLYSLDGGDTWQNGDGSHDQGDATWHPYRDGYVLPVSRHQISPDVEVGRATSDAATRRPAIAPCRRRNVFTINSIWAPAATPAACEGSCPSPKTVSSGLVRYTRQY